MQAFMKEPLPLMLLGGTEETRSLLPRLGWQRVATASRWVLALGAERTLSALRDRVRVPGIAVPLARLAAHAAVRRPGLRPRPRAVPAGGRVVAVASIGEEMLSLHRSVSLPGTWPVWTDALLRWLGAGFPGAGAFVPLYFSIGERLVGFTLTRIYRNDGGCDAEILEVFALEPSVELYTWMISESAVRAAGFGPSIVATSTTSPEVEAALKRNHFLQSSSAPVHVRVPDGAALPEPLRIGSNTGDAALVPFVERWWDAPATAR
jgi:hypothetical protein